MPEIRVISPDTHQMIRTLLQKAKDHHLEAEALEHYAKQLIVTSAQIDLADENWRLDLERGLVIRQEKEPDHAPHETPSMAGQSAPGDRRRHHTARHRNEGDAGTD